MDWLKKRVTPKLSAAAFVDENARVMNNPSGNAIDA
jgi:hypothetical protein